MYAPSRHGGRLPEMTSHFVGGSSSTGEKLWESVCFGSTEGLRGGSMNVLTMLSNALKIAAGIDGVGGCCGCCRGGDSVVFLGFCLYVGGLEVGFLVVVVVVVVDFGFSSILTEEMWRKGRWGWGCGGFGERM